MESRRSEGGRVPLPDVENRTSDGVRVAGRNPRHSTRSDGSATTKVLADRTVFHRCWGAAGPSKQAKALAARSAGQRFLPALEPERPWPTPARSRFGNVCAGRPRIPAAGNEQVQRRGFEIRFENGSCQSVFRSIILEQARLPGATASGAGNPRTSTGVQLQRSRFAGAVRFGILRFVHFLEVLKSGTGNWQLKSREAKVFDRLSKTLIGTLAAVCSR